ncbi:MAG: substrate-binding domain-containing protein [Gammaproteobacteria bacterium]|nr:substrate-binding domain-containing protein [Gammaproteobacteria bacterium]
MNRKPRNKGAPGIVEVAKRANVSAATVSRYFNHPKLVRGTTRLKIEKAAMDLGYIRDRLAGSMHARFSGSIGLIVPSINNAMFAELIEALSSQLQRHDRTTLVASHNYDLDMEVGIVRSLLERRIDGVVLVGKDHHDAALEMLSLREVPIVSVWNYHQSQTMSCVGSDNRDAARAVAQHLITLGHSDIALFFPDTQLNDRARDRMNGVLSALASANIDLDEKRIINCSYSVPESKQRALELLSSSNRPTAILCGNDVIAHGVIYATQQLHLSVPKDISIAGIGDFAGSAEIEPSLTTVRLPARRIGVQAADLVIKQSESTKPIIEHIKIEAEFKLRHSTAQADTA